MGRNRHHKIWIRRRLINGFVWGPWQPGSSTKAAEIERKGMVIGQLRYEVARGTKPGDDYL